jgi:hypothetical protein
MALCSSPGRCSRLLGTNASRRPAIFGEHCVAISDERRDEACMFGITPPRSATPSSKHATQEGTRRHFKRPLWENTTLRSIPNVEGRPSVFSQHVLQPQLVGSINATLSVHHRVRGF